MRGGGLGVGRGMGESGAEFLTSRDNRWLKEFRLALRGGVATSSGAVGVEGVRLAEEALTSGCRIEAVLFSESGERHRERLAPLVGTRETGFPVLRTTDRLFEGIADTEHPQGVAALVVPRTITLEEALATPEGVCAPLVVVLAGVQDPGNVGTILRTATAFGATAAVTAATGQSGTASPFAPKALRASAGTALHLPILAGMALGILLTQLKVRGIRTVASCVQEQHWRMASGGWREEENEKSELGSGTTRDPRSQTERGAPKHEIENRNRKSRNAVRGADERAVMAPWEVEWCEPVAFLVGNEGAGLPEEVVHAADARIHIPMATLPSSGKARVESLNAGAAAAVVLYEAYRQRKAVGSGE